MRRVSVRGVAALALVMVCTIVVRSDDQIGASPTVVGAKIDQEKPRDPQPDVAQIGGTNLARVWKSSGMVMLSSAGVADTAARYLRQKSGGFGVVSRAQNVDKVYTLGDLKTSGKVADITLPTVAEVGAEVESLASVGAMIAGRALAPIGGGLWRASNGSTQVAEGVIRDIKADRLSVAHPLFKHLARHVLSLSQAVKLVAMSAMDGLLAVGVDCASEVLAYVATGVGGVALPGFPMHDLTAPKLGKPKRKTRSKSKRKPIARAAAHRLPSEPEKPDGPDDSSVGSVQAKSGSCGSGNPTERAPSPLPNPLGVLAVAATIGGVPDKGESVPMSYAQPEEDGARGVQERCATHTPLPPTATASVGSVDCAEGLRKFSEDMPFWLPPLPASMEVGAAHAASTQGTEVGREVTQVPASVALKGDKNATAVNGRQQQGRGDAWYTSDVQLPLFGSVKCLCTMESDGLHIVAANTFAALDKHFVDVFTELPNDGSILKLNTDAETAILWNSGNAVAAGAQTLASIASIQTFTTIEHVMRFASTSTDMQQALNTILVKNPAVLKFELEQLLAKPDINEAVQQRTKEYLAKISTALAAAVPMTAQPAQKRQREGEEVGVAMDARADAGQQESESVAAKKAPLTEVSARKLQEECSNHTPLPPTATASVGSVDCAEGLRKFSEDMPFVLSPVLVPENVMVSAVRAAETQAAQVRHQRAGSMLAAQALSGSDESATVACSTVGVSNITLPRVGEVTCLGCSQDGTLRLVTADTFRQIQQACQKGDFELVAVKGVDTEKMHSVLWSIKGQQTQRFAPLEYALDFLEVGSQPRQAIYNFSLTNPRVFKSELERLSKASDLDTEVKDRVSELLAERRSTRSSVCAFSADPKTTIPSNARKEDLAIADEPTRSAAQAVLAHSVAQLPATSYPLEDKVRAEGLASMVQDDPARDLPITHPEYKHGAMDPAPQY